MKLKDIFLLSMNSIAHRELRAWLTLLGVIIGVAAVVSIISIGYGAQASINESLSGFGADLVTISPGSNRAMGMDFSRGGQRMGEFGGPMEPPFAGGNRGRVISDSSTSSSELKESDLVVIKNNPSVVSVNQIVSGRSKVTFNSKESNLNIKGVNPLTWADTENISIESGRFLNTSDKRSVVIGNAIATTTFNKAITLGRQIDINGKYFTVVGILSSSGSSFGGGVDSTVYMNYLSAYDVLENDVNKNTYTSIIAKVKDATNMDEYLESIKADLMTARKVTERNINFSITSSQTIREQISSVTQTMTLFLGAIAAVSLLVGAIGIANSMFTSVLEKTRDIGIMKALGSSNEEILLMFVIESGLFGLIGGILGVLVSFGITFVLNLLGVSLGIGLGGGMRGESSGMLITPELVLFAIFLSTIIGIVSGIIPANNASKMKPVDALKYE
ncbi:MAG: macrolide transporter ATP-binding /permease protein [archaeon ADurb.Bin336]|nr:MAG: macrolide transporter ATP-binding /permease protein [archaeon ADurb.Bin336]